MLKQWVSRLLARRSTARRSQPLVTSQHDVKILKKLHQKKRPSLRQVAKVHKVMNPKEKHLFRWGIALVLIGLVGSVWGLSATYRVHVPKVGGTYTEAVVGGPMLINPLFAGVNEVDTDLSRLVYSGLMRYDKDQELVPDLAESYELSEDKRTYTFHLREDVHWHSGDPDVKGEPFTARDVLYTFEMIQDPDVGSPLALSFQGVAVQQVDAHTVTFTLEEPFQPFLSTLTVGMLPAYLWEQIPVEQLRLTNINLQPIGTGPYQFKKLIKDESGRIARYTLARYADYHLSPAFIEEFQFEFFAEYDGDVGAIQALREGRVDGIHFVPSKLREKVERKHITLHTLQLPQYSALFFNQARQPLLQEDSVREALTIALDKDRIVRESLDHEGRVIDGPILPGFAGYDENLEADPYDLEAANALLDELYPRMSIEEYKEERVAALMEQYAPLETPEEDASSTEAVAEEPAVDISTTSLEQQLAAQVDAEVHEAMTFIRKDDEGNPLVLDLVTADTQEYQQAAELIAGFWQELGIQVRISRVAPRQIPRDVLKERAYDVLLYGVIVGSDPDQYPFWHSSQVAHPGLNLSGYENTAVDTILEEAREAEDEEQLAEKYQELQTLVLEDRPVVFLYTPVYRYATVNDVQGIDVSRIFLPADRFANVTDWFVKTKGEWRF